MHYVAKQNLFPFLPLLVSSLFQLNPSLFQTQLVVQGTWKQTMKANLCANTSSAAKIYRKGSSL